MAQRMGNETCSLPSSPSVAQIISNKKLLLALGEHFSLVVYWPKHGFAHPQTYWQTKFHMTSPSRTGVARWCVRVKAEGVAFLPHVPITTHSNSTAIFWTWFPLPFFFTAIWKNEMLWVMRSHDWVRECESSPTRWITSQLFDGGTQRTERCSTQANTQVGSRHRSFLYWITPRRNLY